MNQSKPQHTMTRENLFYLILGVFVHTLFTGSTGDVNTLSILPVTQTIEGTKEVERVGTKEEIDYVDRFKKTAKDEMEKYGIPASITLAQGLLESNKGRSPLASRHNNHFGIKCFSKKCKKGHCSNFTDDSHKDFFVKYNTAWESYRSHSKLLVGKNYKHLLKHGKDYKKWAHGLKEAGYATDKLYAEKLISLIEKMKLYEYD